MPVTKKDIEASLKAAGWKQIHDNKTDHCIDTKTDDAVIFEKEGIAFDAGWTDNFPRVSYSSLTPELFEELTGIKFRKAE